MTLYTNPLRNVSPGSMITDHKRHVSEIDGGIITCIDRTSKQVSVPVKLGQVGVYDMVIIHTLFLFEGLVAVEKGGMRVGTIVGQVQDMFLNGTHSGMMPTVTSMQSESRSVMLSPHWRR